LRQTRDEILAHNQRNRLLAYESVLIGSYVDLFNNLGTYPSKAQFERNSDELARQWDLHYRARLDAFDANYSPERAAAMRRAREQFHIELPRGADGLPTVSNPYNAPRDGSFFGPDGVIDRDRWQAASAPWKEYWQDVHSAVRQQTEKRDVLRKAAADLNGLRKRLAAARVEITGRLNALEHGN
jgi:hypothetical protein